MTRIHVFCEGQTEEVFVREVLCNHFGRIGISLNPIIVRTGAQGRGGILSYGKIKWQIEKKCKEDTSAWVTTLFDFYGLPNDFPAMDVITTTSTEPVKTIETAFQKDIAKNNFIANLVKHEFEALLFSLPEVFGRYGFDSYVVAELKKIRADFGSPEEINNSKETAPSKRILSLCMNYDKPMHGSLIALDIGLDTIRRECPMFDKWIKRLEKL